LRRRLLNVLAALSLLLCLTMVVLWLRNLGPPPWDDMYVVRPTHSYGVGMNSGGVIGFLQRQRPEYRDADPDDVWVDRFGFRYVRVTGTGLRRWNLVLPAWLVVAATAALPLARAVWHVRAARRRRPGHCPACGYDLTGNVSGVCPECGTPGFATRG
jgi:hypothetical protein